LASPQEAAEEYSGTLKKFFGAGVAWPEFDLVLLGLGEDGHTASLFPGAAALRVTDRWVTFSPPGILPPPVDRVTLTFPVFNAARQVMFLVNGGNKAEAVADIFEGRAPVGRRPAAGIRPASGRTVWLLDRAAARLLTATTALQNGPVAPS
jgi:6-phosphogluconolactonase